MVNPLFNWARPAKSPSSITGEILLLVKFGAVGHTNIKYHELKHYLFAIN